MVTTGRLHENFCALTQVNNGIGYLLQTNVCVRKFAGVRATSPIGRRAATMLLPLDTSIPTAFIFNLPDFEFGFPTFFSLLVQSPEADTNAPKVGGTTCANRMLRTREAADGLRYGRASPW